MNMAELRPVRGSLTCKPTFIFSTKAVKALYLSAGEEAWGHVVARLLANLPQELAAPEELIERAKVLDAFYIPARYPNGFPEGAPFEHFGELQSKAAIEHADAVYAFVRAKMA